MKGFNAKLSTQIQYKTADNGNILEGSKAVFPSLNIEWQSFYFLYVRVRWVRRIKSREFRLVQRNTECIFSFRAFLLMSSFLLLHLLDSCTLGFKEKCIRARTQTIQRVMMYLLLTVSFDHFRVSFKKTYRISYSRRSNGTAHNESHSVRLKEN